MEKYKVVRVLGEGAFGRVVEARDSAEGGTRVAIKQIKKDFNSWEECVKLRELRALKGLRHPHIVRLREMILDRRQLYFVFEFIDSNLADVIDRRKEAKQGGFTASASRRLLAELLEGLSHMHRHNFFHRDIKPENLLCQPDGTQLKIADFGLAREIRSRPPYTEYVSTRWYRAPEVILGDITYSSPVDVWACGCICAELFTLTPIFQGTTAGDQLNRILTHVGSPSSQSWPDGMKLAANRQPPIRLPRCQPRPWTDCLPGVVDQEALALISALLALDPSKRPSCNQALHHPFFRQLPTLPLQDPTNTSIHSSASLVDTASQPSTARSIALHYDEPSEDLEAEIEDLLGGMARGSPLTATTPATPLPATATLSISSGAPTAPLPTTHATHATPTSLPTTAPTTLAAASPPMGKSRGQTAIDELLGELDSAMSSPSSAKQAPVERLTTPTCPHVGPPPCISTRLAASASAASAIAPATKEHALRPTSSTVSDLASTRVGAANALRSNLGHPQRQDSEEIDRCGTANVDSCQGAQAGGGQEENSVTAQDGPWTSAEIAALAAAAEMYPMSAGLDKNVRWKKIAHMVGTRSKMQCYEMYKELSEKKASHKEPS